MLATIDVRDLQGSRERQQEAKHGRCFTWEQPEHAGCGHDQLGEVVAIKPGGTKLAFCKACNALRVVRPPKKRPPSRVGGGR
jgi:hypothetical protein